MATTRDYTLYVVNRTPFNLVYVGDDVVHGKWMDSPPGVIGPYQKGPPAKMKVEKGDATLYGSEAYIWYRIMDAESEAAKAVFEDFQGGGAPDGYQGHGCIRLRIENPLNASANCGFDFEFREDTTPLFTVKAAGDISKFYLFRYSVEGIGGGYYLAIPSVSLPVLPIPTSSMPEAETWVELRQIFPPKKPPKDPGGFTGGTTKSILGVRPLRNGPAAAWEGPWQVIGDQVPRVRIEITQERPEPAFSETASFKVTIKEPESAEITEDHVRTSYEHLPPYAGDMFTPAPASHAAGVRFENDASRIPDEAIVRTADPSAPSYRVGGAIDPGQSAIPGGIDLGQTAGIVAQVNTLCLDGDHYLQLYETYATDTGISSEYRIRYLRKDSGKIGADLILSPISRIA
jgi:hypothetical protein